MRLKRKIVDGMTRIISRIVGAAAGGLSQAQGGDAATKSVSPEISSLCRELAADGAVLLKNDGVLPLSKDAKVALFGRCQLDWFYVGYGSGGDVKTPYLVSPVEGLEKAGVALDATLLSRYRELVGKYPAENGFWGHWPFSHPEFVLSQEEIDAAAARADVAVFIIGRSAGEDRDNRLAEGSYYLAPEEKKMLDRVCSAFGRVVVVMNIGGNMDFGWVENYPLSALLVAWQGGMESGNALADVLTGKREPAGRLTDTVARKYSDYPSAPNFGGKKFNVYAEDIYVGYRYFNTFAEEKVLFPFGFGLGYTTFSLEPSEIASKGETVSVKVNVKNTGERTGSEVVQLYIGFPKYEGGAPRLTLAAFDKLTLDAGESATTVLSARLDDIALFDDENSRYLLPAGDYAVYVGENVRDAVFIGKVKRESEWERKVPSAAAPVLPFNRLTEKDGKPVFRPVPLSKVDLRERILSSLPAALPECTEKVTFGDVREGRHTLRELVATLSEDELEALSRGDFIMNSPLGALGNAGVLGGILPSLREKGIPPVTVTDGPSGIRLASTCSLLPAGVLLASAWDAEKVRRLYEEVGKEMRARGTQVLLGPGMNIHRDPLCGRNFEYFSEDPLLTGKIAASVIRGLASQGVSACPKHFACNNQEYRRNRNDSRVSERALREIYLRGFGIAVREGKPLWVMTSYNKVNGVWSHYNYDLAETVLRGEWGYEGAVMTDWWMRYAPSPEFPAIRDNAYRVRACVDVLMPGDKRLGKREPDGTLLETLGKEDGITLGELQRTAERVLGATLALDIPPAKGEND